MPDMSHGSASDDSGPRHQPPAKFGATSRAVWLSLVPGGSGDQTPYRLLRIAESEAVVPGGGGAAASEPRSRMKQPAPSRDLFPKDRSIPAQDQRPGQPADQRAVGVATRSHPIRRKHDDGRYLPANSGEPRASSARVPLLLNKGIPCPRNYEGASCGHHCSGHSLGSGVSFRRLRAHLLQTAGLHNQ